MSCLLVVPVQERKSCACVCTELRIGQWITAELEPIEPQSRSRLCLRDARASQKASYDTNLVSIAGVRAVPSRQPPHLLPIGIATLPGKAAAGGSDTWLQLLNAVTTPAFYMSLSSGLRELHNAQSTGHDGTTRGNQIRIRGFDSPFR